MFKCQDIEQTAIGSKSWDTSCRILSISNESVRKHLDEYEQSLVDKVGECKMNFNKLKFGDTIGIIGGGQLGKMMAQSAQNGL